MILGNTAHIEEYLGLCENLDKAIRWIRNTDFSDIDDGEIFINGSDVRVKLSTMETKSPDEAKLEAHRDFLDIQLLLSGKETYHVSFLEEVHEQEAHPERDIWFYCGAYREITLNPNQFLILFPNDVHAPGLSTEHMELIRKAVFKIRWH